jgi:hypothetical protein
MAHREEQENQEDVVRKEKTLVSTRNPVICGNSYPQAGQCQGQGKM